MKKRKKIFIPSTGRALVAGEARRKRPRFVLTWRGRQTKKLKFRRSRQVLGKGAFMKKTKINFYSFDGLSISLEKRAKTNRRFCPYLVREAFAKASGRLPEGERETSLRKELSTVIDEVSVGDRREPASRRAPACVGIPSPSCRKTTKNNFFFLREGEEGPWLSWSSRENEPCFLAPSCRLGSEGGSEPGKALGRKKNKISSSDGGPTSDPGIRHTPDFLILLSGGGIPGKKGVRGKKNKISSFDGRRVSLRENGHPPRFLSFLSGRTRCQKEAKKDER
jgi:hypothetical protein